MLLSRPHRGHARCSTEMEHPVNASMWELNAADIHYSGE